MKLFFFNNNTYGICYTVMAESRDEAIHNLKVHLKRQEESWHDKNYDYAKDDEIRKGRAVGNFNTKEDQFVIEEYGSGEIIETEYS